MSQEEEKVPVHQAGRSEYLKTHEAPINLLFSTTNRTLLEEIPNAHCYSNPRQTLLQLQTALNRKHSNDAALLRAVARIAVRISRLMFKEGMSPLEEPVVKLALCDSSLLFSACQLIREESRDEHWTVALKNFVLKEAFSFDDYVQSSAFILAHDYLVDTCMDNSQLLRHRLLAVKGSRHDYVTVLKLASLPSISTSAEFLNALMWLKEAGFNLARIFDRMVTGNEQVAARLFMLSAICINDEEARTLLKKFPSAPLSQRYSMLALTECRLDEDNISLIEQVQNTRCTVYSHEQVRPFGASFALMECHLRGLSNGNLWSFLASGTANVQAYPSLFMPTLLYTCRYQEPSYRDLCKLIVDQYSAEVVINEVLKDKLQNDFELTIRATVLPQLAQRCKMPTIFDFVKFHITQLLLLDGYEATWIIGRTLREMFTHPDNLSRESRLEFMLGVVDKIISSEFEDIKEACLEILCLMIDIEFLDPQAAWARYKAIIDPIEIGVRIAKLLATKYVDYKKAETEESNPFVLEEIEQEVLDFAGANKSFKILADLPLHLFDPLVFEPVDADGYVAFASVVLESEIFTMPRPVLLGTGSGAASSTPKLQSASYDFATLCSWSISQPSGQEARSRFDAFVKSPFSILQLPWFLRPALPSVISRFVATLASATGDTEWMAARLSDSGTPPSIAYTVYILHAVDTANVHIFQHSGRHADRIAKLVESSSNEEIVISGIHVFGPGFAKRFVNTGGVWKSAAAGFVIGCEEGEREETFTCREDARAYFGWCFARWTEGSPLHRPQIESNEPLVVQANAFLTGKPTDAQSEPLDTRYAICLACGAEPINIEHLTVEKVPSQFRMNALMALAGNLGWNPVKLSFARKIDDSQRAIFARLSSRTEAKIPLIASLLLLSCIERKVTADSDVATSTRFECAPLFVHLLQKHAPIAIKSLTRCSQVPRMDWNPYLVDKSPESIEFAIRHVRKETPNGVYYSPSLSDYLDRNPPSVELVKQYGVEPLLFKQNYWSDVVRLFDQQDAIEKVKVLAKHAPKDWIDTLPTELDVIESLYEASVRSAKSAIYQELIDKCRGNAPLSSLIATISIDDGLQLDIVAKYYANISLEGCMKQAISACDLFTLESRPTADIVSFLQRLIIRASGDLIKQADDFELAWAICNERASELCAKLLKRLPTLVSSEQ